MSLWVVALWWFCRVQLLFIRYFPYHAGTKFNRAIKRDIQPVKGECANTCIKIIVTTSEKQKKSSPTQEVQSLLTITKYALTLDPYSKNYPLSHPPFQIYNGFYEQGLDTPFVMVIPILCLGKVYLTFLAESKAPFDNRSRL